MSFRLLSAAGLLSSGFGSSILKLGDKCLAGVAVYNLPGIPGLPEWHDCQAGNETQFWDISDGRIVNKKLGWCYNMLDNGSDDDGHSIGASILMYSNCIETFSPLNDDGMLVYDNYNGIGEGRFGCVGKDVDGDGILSGHICPGNASSCTRDMCLHGFELSDSGPPAPPSPPPPSACQAVQTKMCQYGPAYWERAYLANGQCNDLCHERQSQCPDAIKACCHCPESVMI